ncbi:MAG: sorbosone dehydrogenase family protein [Halobacteriaceae archaeon]
MDRRKFLSLSGGLVPGIAGCGGPSRDERDGSLAPSTGESRSKSTSPSSEIPDSVGLETIASNLQTPLDLAFVPDSNVKYVAEQRGLIRLIDGENLRSDPLLDLRERIATGYEMGLLGIALHPEFLDTRRLFVRYSAPPTNGMTADYDHLFVLSEFQVTSDFRKVVEGSEQRILTIREPQSNHNAGSIAFGPEDHLYIGVGDGGAGGDQGDGHVQDWYDRVGGGNGQDVRANLLGSILRIDPDDRSGDRPYGIPDSNPLVGQAGLDEHYAWGFRNPWRLSFDRDTLYAGDVGQNRYEEVDRVRKGGNYGWNVKEGTHCYGASTCPDATPQDVRNGEQLLDPIIEYPHEGAAVSGISVIIGNVYRGSALPRLQGRFVFGDLDANGELFVATSREEGLWKTRALPIRSPDANKLSGIYSFKRHRGELYVLGSGERGGGIHRLISSK